MNQTTLPLQRGDYPPFLPYNFHEVPRSAACRPKEATTLIERPTIAESAAILGEAAPAKPLKKQTRPATRQAEWERQARAQEIHGWLDNLHLRYENYIARDNDRPGIARPCGSGTRTEQAVTVKAAEPVAKTSTALCK